MSLVLRERMEIVRKNIYISQDWDRWLGMTASALPNKDLDINTLKEQLDDVFMK